MAEDAAAPVTELRDDEIEISDNWDEITPSFDGLGLTEDLLRGIYAYGFERPSAIQQRAIKPVLMGRDVIAQAQSGTFHPFPPLFQSASIVGIDYITKYHLSRLTSVLRNTTFE